jgi:hypothetical protein
MTIVVVEDDLLRAQTLATRLGQGGFTTEIVGDGASALRRFGRSDLDAVDDRVRALEAGADDCVVKPCYRSSGASARKIAGGGWSSRRCGVPACVWRPPGANRTGCLNGGAGLAGLTPS